MFEGFFGKKTESAEVGQADARNNENEWVDMTAGEEKVEVVLHETEMVQPDAPLQNTFERGGYEGNTPLRNEDVGEQVAPAEEGEFLTPFQKQQRLDAMKKAIQEGTTEDADGEEDERMAA